MFISDFFEICISLKLLLGQHLCITGQFGGNFFPLLSHFVNCLLTCVLTSGLLRLLSSFSLPSLAARLLALDFCFDLLLHLLSSSFSLIGQFLSNLVNRMWSLSQWSTDINQSCLLLRVLLLHSELFIPLLHTLLSSFCSPFLSF